MARDEADHQNLVGRARVPFHYLSGRQPAVHGDSFQVWPELFLVVDRQRQRIEIGLLPGKVVGNQVAR
jgi:hypothetical protein